MDRLKIGLSDEMSIKDIAKKHLGKKSNNESELNKMITHLKSQLSKGIKVEKEHTSEIGTAKEIAMDHISEDPNYYTKLKTIEANETSADSSGSFEGAFGGPVVTRKINKIHNFESDLSEVTDSSSSGAYDVSFSAGRSNPLKINGPKSIMNSRAVKDKNFPKWGGPGGVFVRVKEKCKKFPYCNQGNTGAIEFYEVEGLKESTVNVAKKTGIPYSEIEKLVINEINKIFIK